MNLYKIRPGSFTRFGDRYNRFFDFDHFMGRNPFEDSWIVDSRDKVTNGKKYYKIDIALPGFSKKDIQVNIQENLLSVQIVKSSQLPDCHKSESDDSIQLGRRYYRLFDYLDKEHTKVKYRDGILKIRIPYKPEYSQMKKRTVEVS